SNTPFSKYHKGDNMNFIMEGISVDIDVNTVRNHYNSSGPMDLKPIVHNAKLQLNELSEIYKKYLLYKSDPVRSAIYEFSWDKCLEKLNEYVVQIKRLGSDFEIPSELRNSKLSTFVKKYSNFININNSNTISRDASQLSMPGQLMQVKYFGDIGMVLGHNDVPSRDNIISTNRENDKRENHNSSLPDLMILDENDMPFTKHSASQSFKKAKKSCAKLTNNQRLTNQCIQSRIDSGPVNKACIVPMKRPAATVLKRYTFVRAKSPPHVLDKKLRGEKCQSQLELFDEDKNILPECFASGSRSDPISLVSSDEEDDITLTNGPPAHAVVTKEVVQPLVVESYKRIDTLNLEAQKLDIVVDPHEVVNQNFSTQNIKKSTRKSEFEVQSISPQDIEIKALYFKHDKEQDIAKKLLFEKRDYKIKTAMKQEVYLDDPSYDIDNVSTVISYMALNDIFDKPLTFSSSESQIVHKLNQLKSYDFKCGSGDVNEIALNYSNPSEPIIAMGYIANADPNYNSPGNLQFLDIKQGAVYNLWGHIEEDSISKLDVWTTVTDVKFSPDGNFIFSASTDASIKVWRTGDAKSYLKPFNTKVCERPTYGTKYQFASCEDSGLVQVHFIRSDKKQAYTMVSQEFIEEKCNRVSSDVNFVSSYQVIAGYNGNSSDSTGVVKVWDINSRKKTCYNKQLISSSVSCLDVSHDEKWITCGTTAGLEDREGDGSMHIWDMLSQTTLCAFTGEKDINVISISPNDQYIALGGMMNTVYVYDKRYLNQSLHVLRHE
ncbi:12727_t:CDS:10, partial [Cetraspora pellucida]